MIKVKDERKYITRAFTTAVFILVGCWVVKVLWKAAFG